jgi:two-component system NtrC family sensor kinase
MNRISKPKLVYKFLLFVLPLIFLSIVMTGAILSWASYNYFLKTIRQDYSNVIRSSAGEIRLFMKDAQRDLEALASTIAATKIDRWQKEMALTAFNHTAVQFMSVALISPGGKAIASSGGESRDLADVDQSEVFQKALMGEPAMSGVMLTKDNMPYLHFAVPVLRLGETKEILWGKLNLKSVWDVLDEISIGDTGHVSIMSLSGRFIGHREIDRVVTTMPAERPDAFKELLESDAPVEWIEKKDEIRVFCLGYYIPDLDWVVVLSQRYSEIYEYLYYNIFWAALVTLMICFLAVIFGWNGVKRFLTPVHDLHRQVQKIGQGDLDQKVSVDSQDEVGDLARAFNEMTKSLKKFIRREVETAKQLVHANNLAILGSTSSKVTHEVGNLLNNVGLVLPILKDEKLSSDGEMAIRVLEKDSARITTFIHDFCQFAKKPELTLRRESIEKIIREVLFVHERDAQGRGIHLELKWPSGLPPVNVDSRLMYQVVSNLVKNSLQAMTDPGIIDIEGSTSDGHLLVRIMDSGPGIESQTLERIFDPFFTTKGRKGTGLGLSIVKTVVEAHRGVIECQSELNRGTSFVISLPLH